jgi:hypothetical protein
MDGSFACPECGSEVEVEGLAPGRQVRCGFCHRLLEVPYLPRVPVPSRRRRFGPSKWVRWTWFATGVIAAFAVIITGMRFVRREIRSVQEGSINKFIDSSRNHEAAGRLGLALVDLDAALDLLRRSGTSAHLPLEELRKQRADLARREFQGSLDQLARPTTGPYPLGEWLGLRARSSKDPDLAELKPKLLLEFRRSLRHQASIQLEAARKDLDSGRVVASLQACDRIAKLLSHLPPEDEVTARRETEALVVRLVETHGVAIETAKGDFVFGSFENYLARLMPMLLKGLENKGYLPYRDASPWKSAWQHAPYHLRLEVSERQLGNYLSSENRLSRIEAHLVLMTSPRRLVWETRPPAQTRVPLPGLTVYESRQLAVSRGRMEAFERRLYEDTRAQIDAKFGQALASMPACCE